MPQRSMDELKTLSDQEKLSYLDSNTDLSTFKKRQLISSILDDGIKSSLFNKYANGFNAYDKTVIIKSFSQDSIKLDYLKMYENDFRSDLKSQILITVEDDNIKLDCLNNLKTPLYTQNQVEVIQSLKSDEKRIEFLEDPNFLSNSYHKRLIIETLPTDELKVKYLNKFIQSFLPKESVEVITSLDDDNIKKRYLSIIRNKIDEPSVAKIISTFKNDENKLAYIESNRGFYPSGKAIIIKSLSDDTLKVQQFKRYKDEIRIDSRASIVSSIKDDKLKIQLMDDDDFYFDFYKQASILDSFQSEELKVNYIFTHYADVNPTQLLPVMLTITDKKAKEIFLERHRNNISKNALSEISGSINNDKNVAFISSLEDDDLKLEFLISSSGYISTTGKVELLSYFEDEEKKLKAFLAFNDEFDSDDRLSILKGFKSEILILEALGHINEDLFLYGLINTISLLQSEELRIEAMILYEDDLGIDGISKISSSIENENIKLDSLMDNQIELSDKKRLLMICSLNDEKSLETLGYVLDDSHKKTLNLPPDMTFGIEIEVEGTNSSEMLKARQILSQWKTVKEASLDNGVEVVSPILHDVEKDMHSIGLVSKVLEDFNFYTSERSGGHIHFGADFLGYNIKSWEALFTIYNECEEIFYKMSNDVGEIPRERVLVHAETTNHIFGSAFKFGEIDIKNQEDLNDIISEFKNKKSRGLNLMNLGRWGKNTIEFRMPNGSLKPEIIKENIKLFGTLLKVSKEMGLGSKDKEEKYEAIKNKGLSEADKVDALLELLFDNEEDRSIYRNRWDSVKDNKIFYRLKANWPTFKRGDYSMKKEVKPMFDETSLEDRSFFIEEMGRESDGLENSNRFEDQEIS